MRRICCAGPPPREDWILTRILIRGFGWLRQSILRDGSLTQNKGFFECADDNARTETVDTSVPCASCWSRNDMTGIIFD